MQFQDWLAQWLSYEIRTTKKAQTYQKYCQVVRQYIRPKLGNYNMEKLSATVLQKFGAQLAEQGLSPTTVAGILSPVKHSLTRAFSLGLTKEIHVEAMVRPRAREKQIECFSETEQKQIENYILCGHSCRLYGILVDLYTGLRIGELLALKWENVDLDQGVLCVKQSCRDAWKNGRYVKILDSPKTLCAERTIPLPKQLLPVLLRLRQQSSGDYVVFGKTEQGVQIRSYQRSFDKMLKTLHLPHRGFHALRHTFATRAVECGMDIKTLSELMGHADPSTTLKRYAHSLLFHKIEMMNVLGKIFTSSDILAQAQTSE